MKLKIMGFDNDVIFDDTKDTVLIIEDKSMFAHIISLLNNAINYSITNEEIKLLDDEKVIDYKNVELIIDPFNIDLNSKKIIAALYKSINLEFVDDINSYNDFKKNILVINEMILEYLNNYNLEFEYDDEIVVSNYLKLINLHLSFNPNQSLIDKLLDYLEVFSELISKGVLICCNVLSLLTYDEIKELCKYKKYKHIDLLFIENKYDSNYNLDKYIIDSDLYEYKE